MATTPFPARAICTILVRFGMPSNGFATMTRISAIIHTLNHGHCVGRAIESLHPCEEIVIIDGGSSDNTLQVARQFGARVVHQTPPRAGLVMDSDVTNDWVLCLLPTEALVESLEASLYEWKRGSPDELVAYSVAIREEVEGNWRGLPAEVRFVHRRHVRWEAGFPVPLPGVRVGALEGALARVATPAGVAALRESQPPSL